MSQEVDAAPNDLLATSTLHGCAHQTRPQGPQASPDASFLAIVYSTYFGEPEI